MSIDRRQFAALALGASPLMPACSASAPPAYEEVVRALWRHGRVDRGDAAAVGRELVRYATLAPSSHNTQCWRFAIAPGAIAILPDYARRCPVVDPDDHHLFVSLGCAAENLAQAAAAHGLNAHVAVDAAGGMLRAVLEPAPPRSSSLFEAIPVRQSTRAEYDGRPLSGGELRALEQAASARGVQVILLTGSPALEQVLEFVLHGNGEQMKDEAFVQELKTWIRFSADQAVSLRDGLYSASSGNPPLPPSLGRLMFDLFFTRKRENDRYARHVRSSSGVAVFVAAHEDRRGWVEVGRAYQRFALQAAALEVRTAHLNQPVEVAALRAGFASFLGIAGKRPDLVVRFGRGPAMPPSLRRPVEAVLV